MTHGGLRARDGSRVGQVNQYCCLADGCKYTMTTIDRAAGVTPWYIRCPVCTGVMHSKNYRLDSEMTYSPTHQWIDDGSDGPLKLEKIK